MKTKAISDQELEQAKDQMLNLLSEDKMNFQDELCSLICQARFEIKMSDDDILNQIAQVIRLANLKPKLSRENILAYAENYIPIVMYADGISSEFSPIRLIKVVRAMDDSLGLREAKAIVDNLFPRGG